MCNLRPPLSVCLSHWVNLVRSVIELLYCQGTWGRTLWRLKLIGQLFTGCFVRYILLKPYNCIWIKSVNFGLIIVTMDCKIRCRAEAQCYCLYGLIYNSPGYILIGLVYRPSVVPTSNFLEPKMMSWNALLLIIVINYTVQNWNGFIFQSFMTQRKTRTRWMFSSGNKPMKDFVPNRCYQVIFLTSAEVNNVQECLSAFGRLLRTCWQLLRSSALWMRKLIESINQVSELLPIILCHLLSCVTTPFY